MQLKGKKIQGPNVEIIIIPRGDGDDIVFKAQAVLDMEAFKKIVPFPKPPVKMMKGGSLSDNVEDPSYKLECIDYANKKMTYMILKSLEATEGLIWDRAKLDDVNTWQYLEDELKQSGFVEQEINLIYNGVMAANCLNDTKLEEARKRFTLSQAEALAEQSSPTAEPNFTPPGELANVSR